MSGDGSSAAMVNDLRRNLRASNKLDSAIWQNQNSPIFGNRISAAKNLIGSDI